MPAPGPAGRRHRDRGLAGAPPPRDEPLRLQARHRGPADDRRLRRHRAVARAAEAAAGADRGRHPRGRPQRLERLEGPAAARALPRGRGGDGGRRPAGPPRAADRARQAQLAEALATRRRAWPPDADRDLPRPPRSALLAGLPDRRASAPRADRRRGRCRAGAPGGRLPHRRVPRPHRAPALRRRPSRACS